MEVNYKSYQKVLNLPIRSRCCTGIHPSNHNSCDNISSFNSNRKSSKLNLNNNTEIIDHNNNKLQENKILKPKKDQSQIKRRTKTGCLTCRKRKKKCDESKIDGKCQACTRNSLDCSWPDLLTTKSKPRSNNKIQKLAETKISSDFIKNPQVEFVKETSPSRSTKCDINSLLSAPTDHNNQFNVNSPNSPNSSISPNSPSSQPQNAYPSPVQSPRLDDKQSAQPSSPDISHVRLPPLFNFNNYKLHTINESNVRGVKVDKEFKENSYKLPSFNLTNFIHH